MVASADQIVGRGGASPLIANFDPKNELTPATLFDYVPIKVG